MSTLAGFTSRWTSARRRQLALGVEQRPQVAALHEAHGEVELSVVLPRLVDGDHVRMVERRGEARLAEETGAEALVLRQLRRDQLERHGALERQVCRPVDDAHAAATDQRLDPVAGESRARSERCLHRLRRVRAERTIRSRSWKAAGGRRPRRRPPAVTLATSAGHALAPSYVTRGPGRAGGPSAAARTRRRC